MNKNIEIQLKKAKSAALSIGLLSSQEKNKILGNIAKGLRKNKKSILAANANDVIKISEKDPMRDRLILNVDRIENMAREIEILIKMPDPVGEIFDCSNRLGLKICKQRVPIGVIGAIYESRPNVTTDIAAICIKSGNACVLKGGKEARESYQAIYKVIEAALGKNKNAVQLIDPTLKDVVLDMLHATGLIDVIIPRGSSRLINFVRENSKVPVIETGAGVCHTFVDESAKIDPAAKIIFNAKTQRPSVCNALDTLVIHKKIAKEFLPVVSKLLKTKNVEIFADKESFAVLKGIYPRELLHLATPASFGQEFLSQKMSIKTVSGVEVAIDFINTHTSKHSEAILTENKKNSEKFLKEIDAAVVYSNASTRFSDGACFGLGTEIGISNGKLHARGPMGAREMTTYKWVVKGKYNTRK